MSEMVMACMNEALRPYGWQANDKHRTASRRVASRRTA